MGTLLHWLSTGVAYVLVGFEKLLTFLGMDPASGWTWALSIVGLVLFIRILLIPLFVKQIKATRAQQIIAPDLKKIQLKYKGKKDQASREAMSRETMALYSKHKTNPFASCLPMLVQAPIFFALFRVLNHYLKNDGIGPLTKDLAKAANESTIFGAPISDSFNLSTDLHVKVVAVVLITAMVLTTFLTQRQITRKNMPASAMVGTAATMAKVMMYVMPFTFVLSGPFFPIGVLIYWTTSNLWTMGQQYYVIRRNPTPGSEAEKSFLERKAKKASRTAPLATPEDELAAQMAEEEASRAHQRQQPQRKNRRRK